MNEYSKWTKKYRIIPRDEVAEFIVQAIEHVYYFGVVLYLRRNLDRQNQMVEPAYSLITVNFGAETEELLKEQFKEWLATTFPNKDFELVEIKQQ